MSKESFLKLLKSAPREYQEHLLTFRDHVSHLLKDGEENGQKGICFPSCDDIIVKVFPGTGIQFPTRKSGQANPAPWVKSGVNFLKLHFQEAPSPASFFEEARRLFESAMKLREVSLEEAASGIPEPEIRLEKYTEPTIPVSRDYVDPYQPNFELIDRGNKAHRDLELRLCRMAKSKGFEPLKAREGADFDIGWRQADVLHVVEVKSLTPENETRQLRLGLGQVLQYAHKLKDLSKHVQPILAVERKPADLGWLDLCAALNVRLVWPDCLGKAF